MIKTLNPLYGQSNYDIALKATGSFDNIISFLNLNGVNDVNSSKKTAYSYDTNSVVDRIVSGNNYQTMPANQRFFDPTFFDSSFFQ